MWSSSSIPYVIEPYYTIESSSSFSRWGEGGSGLAKEPLRILASFFFFCEIIDLGSTRKNELAQHPIILTCTRSSGRIHVWYPIIPVRALLNMAIRSGYLGISSHRAKSCLCAEKVWKISGRDCGPVRRLDRFLETYPFFYDERCHWDLGLWILTKHGLRSGKHWNLWSLWKRFQERFGMTGFRILCVSRKCNA